MKPELYKRWRLGLGFVTAKELADHLEMAAISISTYESRGSGTSADDKLLRILEKKIIERDDDFINAVIDTAIRFGKIPDDFQEGANQAVDNEKLSQATYQKTLEQRVLDLEQRVLKLEAMNKK
ncbi:MAG: hypothetical protein PUB15_02160 [Ruminobacter sp.]|nr:hypothetical protein [Ruminobacter sp.]